MASENLEIDANNKVVAGAITDDSNKFIKMLRIDDATKALKVSVIGGIWGTVTSVSVVSANGFAGTVATATTTPAITLTTTINAPVLAGDGTAISAAATTGSGSTVVLSTSPVLVTPSLGVATATSINGNTFTTGTYTLTGQAGKTLTFNGSITLTGTDAQTYTFPTTSATIARTDAANTFTGVQTMTSPALTTPAITGLSTGSGVASAATVSTLATRDANANLTANNHIESYTTTVTANQTTTLVVGSTYQQYFTGSTANQIVQLPVTSTLVLGQQFNIVNTSSVAITVNSSGGNLVQTIAAASSAIVTCILTSGTTAASWSVAYFTAGGTGTVTTVSVVTANGISGSVANPTTTPAITLTLGAITPSSVQITGLTASQILGLDASSNVVSLPVATYPSLTELSYVKGVTSAIQTQIGTKQNTITFGTGVQTALGVNIGSAGAPVLFNGALGTPSSGTATNITGLPAASVLAGSLGTGAYVMDTKLTVPQIITTANAITASGNAATVPVTSKNNIVTNNSAATLTITLTTSGAVNMQTCIVQILDASAVAQTLTLVNTENSTVTAPTTTNGSTTLPLTLGFIFNSATTKWRLIASA